MARSHTHSHAHKYDPSLLLARKGRGKKRSQPRRKGIKRTPLPSTIRDNVWRVVDQTARKFNCSRSWVVYVALATAMHIPLEGFERYDS